MSSRFRLQVSSGLRDLRRLPADEDELGMALFEITRQALDKGLPRPAMVRLQADRVDQFDAVPLLQAQPVERERMFAAIAGEDGVECCALAGALHLYRRRPGRPVLPQRALVIYIEWPDNRWWTAFQLLDEQRTLLGEEPVIRRAIDGSPRPGGVGGWFARARREGLKLTLERDGGQPGLDLVH